MTMKSQQSSDDGDPGAPEWMVTFSDCMTLLLTFFVLLLSFSSFDDKVFPRMESAFAEGLTSLGLTLGPRKEAFELVPRINYDGEDPKEGSEQPVEDGQYESNPSTALDFSEFQNRKVFLIPSRKIFLGRGVRLSVEGHRILSDLAVLLAAVPDRVIVSEHAVENNAASEDQTGLARAWKTAQFLIDQRDLDRMRFSISSASTMDEYTLQHSGLLAANPNTERVIEIVILDRSVFN